MYKKEGHEKFTELLARIQHDIAYTIFQVSMTKRNNTGNTSRSQSRKAAIATNNGTAVSKVGDRKTETIGIGRKLGRNELCHCGSGKKFKKCHGS
jgi:preprotein translocase subunit SecA